MSSTVAMETDNHTVALKTLSPSSPPFPSALLCSPLFYALLFSLSRGKFECVTSRYVSPFNIRSGTTYISLTFVDMSAWKDLFVPEPVVKALADLSFTSPTLIQALTLPAAIRDRQDILGAAETVRYPAAALWLFPVYVRYTVDTMDGIETYPWFFWCLFTLSQ